MFKYPIEFRQDAIELVKKIGITRACKELNVAHGTVRRWCQEMNVSTSAEAEESENTDMDAMMEKRSEEPPPPDDLSEDPGSTDTIATAMAMLVIENTRLREIIQHLRDTISGLTDHRLL